MRTASFLGRLARDWEKKEANGKVFYTNSLAVNKSKDETLWVSLSVWNEKQAETLGAWAKKGDYVAVTGEPDVRAYAAKDGTAKAELQLRVNNFGLVFSKREEVGTTAEPVKVELSDEIPF